MAKTLIKGALLGGIVLFLWNFISWTAIPWHNATMHRFTDDTQVTAALRENAPRSGVYVYPTEEDSNSEQPVGGPTIFLAYSTTGDASMTRPLILSFLLQVIIAGLVTALLYRAKNLTYWGRVAFVTFAAFTAGVVCFLPPWIWFRFATDYTLVMLADLTVGGFLLGLVIAKWASPEPA
ncbi:MAG TPA: hypothetical protein VGX68_29525 [Thermoanaerobaculia bacterium]|jgi:hypothetical protein|nr:hypothetical protein [Thermoanaerobaculia bacterium]